MDPENISLVWPQTVKETNHIYLAFLKAVNENNEDLINSIISIDGIIQTPLMRRLINIVVEKGTVKTATKMIELGFGRGFDINDRYYINDNLIFNAIKHSTNMVKLFLKYGASLNVQLNGCISPLQHALSSGSEETVQIILSKIFANPIQNNVYPTTLENSEEILKALFHYKSFLQLQPEDFPGTIFFAARTGNPELVKLALDACREYLDSVKDKKEHQLKIAGFRKTGAARPPEDINFQGRCNKTALHYAVRHQLPEVVRFLLNAGADVNCKSCRYFTPLHYAAMLGNEDICKILLSFGAEVNPTPSKLGLLNMTCGRIEILKYMDSDDTIDCGKHLETMTELAFFNNFDVTFNLPLMKLLLENKANPETITPENITPLLEACRSGHLDALKLLLEFNANIEVRDRYRNSALHYAALSNNTEIVDFLLDKGLYIEIKNFEGCSPFFFAVESNEEPHLKMIEHLADLGADINSRNIDGATALQIASYNNWFDVIECLLALGADYKLYFGSEIMPKMYRRSSRQFFFPSRVLGSGQRAIIAFNAMKEETLGDHIICYIQGEFDEFEHISNKMRDARDHFEQSKLELSEMKSIKIVKGGRYSFYDFLTSNIYSAVKMIKCNKTRTVFFDNQYGANFPCYKNLLGGRFKRVVALEKYVNKMVDFINKCEKMPNLPILVLDEILSFFDANDFRTFGRNLCKRRL